MSSLRTTRGVDIDFGNLTDMEKKRSQWGMITAGRVLDCLYPETSLGDGNSVVEDKASKEKKYTATTLSLKGKEYFQNIYELNQQGIAIIPDIEDFCMYIGVSRNTFYNMCVGHDINLSICGNNIRNAIASCKKQMAFNGEIPPVVFAIDFNNNHDYVQAKAQLQVQTTTDGDAQASIDEIASRLPIEEVN